jgi:hypothetical protein
VSPRKSFRSWLLGQGSRNDPVGDLARDFCADDCGARVRTAGGLRAHIKRIHSSWELVFDALDAAEKQYAHAE